MLVKKLSLIVFSAFWSLTTSAQTLITDTLLKKLAVEKEDTTKVRILNYLTFPSRDLDSSLGYLEQALKIAERINYTKGRFITLERFRQLYTAKAEYPRAIEYGLKSIGLAEQMKDTSELFEVYFGLLSLHFELYDSKTPFEYLKKMSHLLQSGFFDPGSSTINGLSLFKDRYSRNKNDALRKYYNGMATAFKISKQVDSSRYYYQLCYRMAVNKDDSSIIGLSAAGLATTFSDVNPDSSFYYYRIAEKYINKWRFGVLFEVYGGMSKLYTDKKMYDSALYFAGLAINESSKSWSKKFKLEASLLLYRLYAAQNKTDSAYKYLSRASLLKDTLYGVEKLFSVQLLSIKEKERIEKAAQEKLDEQKRASTQLKFSLLIIAIVIVTFSAVLLIRNNRQKQKANKILEIQKNEINLQKSELETTLENLKATQAQLVQAEKMASLGELTAGIAHEIQNPLNFVNNFSEVSSELIDEMNAELNKGDIEEAKVISSDIKQNLEKINHHGNRAADIVKGMLQHSRSSSGVKEPTDINKLADEYLRLAYHGLRAKDKFFNATMITNYDESLSADEAGLGNINIIPQDIGRVILNLITNAFYVVNEKKTLRQACLPDRQAQGDRYEPTVTLSTKRLSLPSGGPQGGLGGGSIIISVRDNGPGIPQKILDKIFQPFFTTKPTGKGTGLGLSLSYDIVKAHGGEIKVETKEGEGSEFIIQLPNQSS